VLNSPLPIFPFTPEKENPKAGVKRIQSRSKSRKKVLLSREKGETKSLRIKTFTIFQNIFILLF